MTNRSQPSPRVAVGHLGQVPADAAFQGGSQFGKGAAPVGGLPKGAQQRGGVLDRRQALSPALTMRSATITNVAKWMSSGCECSRPSAWSTAIATALTARVTPAANRPPRAWAR